MFFLFLGRKAKLGHVKSVVFQLQNIRRFKVLVHQIELFELLKLKIQRFHKIFY